MIVCFSGCGNSRMVANLLASRLGEDRPVMLEGATLANAELDATGNDRVVWVFPVYSWGVPPVLVDFIRRVDFKGADRVKHHLVMTCGDDAGYTDCRWRRLLRRRGWSTATAATVEMPNTYTLMKGFDVDPDAVAAEKIARAPYRVDDVAKAIEGVRPLDRPIVRGSFPWFKSYVIYPWFKRYAMSPKPFHALDACTRCGLCVRSCPLGNITTDADRRPAWGDRCALCLRCYHICPSHAVAYGTATQGKGQWVAK